MCCSQQPSLSVADVRWITSLMTVKQERARVVSYTDLEGGEFEVVLCALVEVLPPGHGAAVH